MEKETRRKTQEKRSTKQQTTVNKNLKKEEKTEQKKKCVVKKRRGGIHNIKYLGGLLFTKMVRGGSSSMRSNAEEVNKLNVFPVPDGDTGDNMRMTIESGIAAIENLDTDDLAYVMKLFSHGMLLGARGNSGVILSQFFAGMAKGLETESRADPDAMAHALEMGVEQAYTSVMTPTEGTILTVAREAVEYAVARMTPKSTIRTLFADLVKEMHASLERTPEILAVLREAGVVDSGGAGLVYIMDGFNRVLNGEEPEDAAPSVPTQTSSVDVGSFGPDSVMTYGYCTEFLLQLQNKKTDIDAFDVEALKTYLSRLGDSIVAFKTDSIVKVHVHTMHPERIMAVARRYGEFLTVKIENMSVQHTDQTSEGASTALSSVAEAPTAPQGKRKPYGIVAVSNGDGISALLREFGADMIVEGGQTNNPSTADFLSAYDMVRAEHIFVLPNNGNILMSAEQSAEIYDKATVHVVAAKTVGAGYAALSTADLTAPSYEQILQTMNEAIDRVTTGYISPAIRDADMNGVHVTCGDTIGLIDKEIVVSCAERTCATYELLRQLVEERAATMLTVFCGKDASVQERAALEAHIHKVYPTVEGYVIDGGQDIYPYIFVAE